MSGEYGPQCATCGATYAPRRSTQRYCSVPCARKKNGGHNRKDESWWTNNKGYVVGRLWANGRPRHVKRHRVLVERRINRALKPHEDVHHINGDKGDNRPENLEVISHGAHSTKSNLARSRTGRGYRITPDQARAMVVRRAAGETCNAIAADFGVSKGLVSLVTLGKVRAHQTKSLLSRLRPSGKEGE